VCKELLDGYVKRPSKSQAGASLIHKR